MDHRYQQNGKNNEQTIWRGDDPNHFSPDYFRDTVWNNPDLEKSERSYRMANDFYNQHGGKIINLTPNSALDVFEKGNIDDYRSYYCRHKWVGEMDTPRRTKFA
jgi:hypothetical protein